MRVSGIPFVQGRNRKSSSIAKTGVAIHCTDNDAPSKNEASYATRRTDGIGSHLYCDDDEVIQSVDTADTVGHAGSGHGNRQAIAVELTGRTYWSRQQWLDNIAWPKLGAALAQICRAHGIPVLRCTPSQMSQNPQVRGFYGHNDMRLAWGGTTHTDPGANFPWEHLFNTVRAAMGGAKPAAGGTAVADPNFTSPNPWAGSNTEEMIRHLVTGEEPYKTNPDPTFRGGKVKAPNGAAYPTPPTLHGKLDSADDKLDQLLARPAADFTDAQVETLGDRLFGQMSEKLGEVVVQAMLDERVRAARREDVRIGANAAEDS